VVVTRFIITNSIEERILELQKKKNELARGMSYIPIPTAHVTTIAHARSYHVGSWRRRIRGREPQQARHPRVVDAVQ
jgi:hypothetical protein